MMTLSPRDRLTRTSMSLAVLAIFSIFTFPVVCPYIFGSVSLVLAIISKGNWSALPRRGKTAAVIALIALALNTALIVSSALYFVRVLHDPELQMQFSQTLYQMYGITFEELLEQLGLQSSALGNL